MSFELVLDSVATVKVIVKLRELLQQVVLPNSSSFGLVFLAGLFGRLLSAATLCCLCHYSFYSD